MPNLDPDGLAVDLGKAVIRTPGLSGKVTLHDAGSSGMRGAEDSTTSLREALAHNDVDEDFTLEITEPREIDASSGTRASGGSDDIVLEARNPGEGFGQAVLYAAEDGTLSWHFPAGSEDATRTTRGGSTLTYKIPRSVSLGDDGGGHRGAIGAVGSKIIKVLIYRLADKALGAAGNYFAKKYEQAHRPYGLRAFTPANYSEPSDETLDDAELKALAHGPSLLFVHGTMSTAHGGFGTIPKDVMTELFRRYEGRVFAFNHHTISSTPTDDAATFASMLPMDTNMTVDIVAHSRGGLVGRVMTEHAAAVNLAGRVQVRNLVMVATPNAGTVLADREKIEQLLNRLTCLVQFIPDNGATDTLDIIIAVVKQVAVGVFGGLEGISAMNPRGDYLTSYLKGPASTDTRYFAAASNFEPPHGSPLLRVARDAGTDVVFGHVPNDLVVPTEGVYTVPGASHFPIPAPLLFGSAAGVSHSTYWTQPDFAKSLLAWLPDSSTP
jgi:pimeloyl-ACP methyl ester carboxylesterase